MPEGGGHFANRRGRSTRRTIDEVMPEEDFRGAIAPHELVATAEKQGAVQMASRME